MKTNFNNDVVNKAENICDGVRNFRTMIKGSMITALYKNLLANLVVMAMVLVSVVPVRISGFLSM